MINWGNIRTINNTQNEGFEELVCQLARNERGISNKKQFIRKGKPDAGIEGFWILNDDTEIAWQAKFFLFSPTSTQWSEVDSSVKTALEKHPKLTRYYIAIPVDRPDARIDGKKSMLEKWEDHVTGWKALATRDGMSVSFEYWGQSELVERLSYKENEGKERYWFNTTEFTDEWLNDKTDFAIDALGERYTPEINFQLPIAQFFDGLSRNNNFRDVFVSKFESVLKTRRNTYHVFGLTELKGVVDKADSLFAKFKDTFLKIELTGIVQIDTDTLWTQCSQIDEILENCLSILYEKQKELEVKKPTPRHGTKLFSSSLTEIYNLQQSLTLFKDFLSSYIISFANHPYMILIGEGGFGKSHLLADIVIKRKMNNQASVFLLGQHFVTEESPWKQILSSQLRLSGDEYSFLGALNAKAEADGSRILIVIDAINEGKGKIIWKDQLKHFIKSIQKFEWLGLVVSVRTSYEKLTVDETIYGAGLAKKIIHYGFSEQEYEAADFFFDAYKIKKPRIPFLHPEFRSPLFLKLFCEGLKRKGLSEIPAGYEGISAIIGFFLNGINERLSKQFNYNTGLNLVRVCVEALATRIASQDENYIAFNDAIYFFNDLKPLRIIANRTGFFNSLIDEGVLSKNVYWKDDGTHEEGIYFVYERFFDHLIASFLIAKMGTPSRAFKKRGRYHKYFKDVESCFQNRGLLEALSIQIPEVTDFEFFELIPDISESRPVAEAFLESIIWRKKESFWEKEADRNWIEKSVNWLSCKIRGVPLASKLVRITNYIREVALLKNNLMDSLLENLLLICSVPDHVFNANYLHDRLIRLSMPDRDGWFVPWLNNHYYDGSPITRLIDWGWQDEKREYIDDESIYLSCVMLSWFLISPNRTLRDHSTKALICLLQYREHLLTRLLKNFETVNDPYLYERLFGVAYGCTVRAENIDFLPELCAYIYEIIFNKEKVYPHMLLRDYARGTIDYAVKNGCIFDFDLKRINPPYKSDEFPELPTVEDIDRKYKLTEKDSPNYYYQNEILDSMTTEYGRGVARYGDFGRYTFESALSDWDVNPNALSNYAVELVFEKLGYNVKKHGKYDRNRRSGRSGDHSERIGKKYQWIAFFEVLARVADHYPIYDESVYGKKKEIKYCGTWYPNVRDIDVTTIIRSTEKTKFDDNVFGGTWWQGADYDNWEGSNFNWMQKKDDLPTIPGLLEIKDPDGNDWLCLEMMPEWAEQKKVGEDRWDTPHKRIYLQLRSYLVKKDESKAFIKWGKSANFRERHLPEAQHMTEVFSREYYWSDAYKFFQKPYYNGEDFHELYDDQKRKLICNAHIPVQYILWEEEFDASKDQTITFYKPSTILHEGLKMKYSHEEGTFVDASKKLVCFDPSVNKPGPSCLLVRKDRLAKFLYETGMSLGWTVLGEKQILGSRQSKDDERVTHYINGFYYLDVTGEIKGNFTSEIKIYD